MSKKLYCGNLSYSVGSSQLEQMFAAFGSVVSAQVIVDRDTGRSKGFGFVEMSSAQEATAAIEGQWQRQRWSPAYKLMKLALVNKRRWSLL
ncbi:MAG: hypothetical protein U0905_20820 [Pirellulales bacterium]